MSHTTSDARKRAAEHPCEPPGGFGGGLGAALQPPCGTCGAKWTSDHRCSTVPRVARSLEDLRVGQVVAWAEDDPDVAGRIVRLDHPERLHGFRDWDFTGPCTLVILADPPEPDYLVPRAVMERLRGALGSHESIDLMRLSTIRTHARAVLDAATKVEDR